MTKGKVPDNLKDYTFDKRPDLINKNGRPKKGVSLINDELEEMGYTPATKADIEVNYLQMVQLTNSELKAIEKDYSKPMLVRIVAKSILSNKGFDVIERMFDRSLGKPKQEVHQKVTQNFISVDELTE